MREINRAYRILGLPPGAPQEDVKRAYRDLAQVWHPDRFAHNPRLQRKAQENLRRINEAFEVLRSYDPEEAPRPASRLSQSFSAITGIGDMLSTAAYKRHRQAEQVRRAKVVGVGAAERTGVYRRPRRARTKNWVWMVSGTALLVLAAAIFLLLS